MPEKASREHVEMGGRNPKKNDYEGVGGKRRGATRGEGQL